MSKKHSLLIVVAACFMSLLLAACSVAPSDKSEQQTQETLQGESVKESSVLTEKAEDETESQSESIAEMSIEEVSEVVEEGQEEISEPEPESGAIERTGYDYSWTSNGEDDRIGYGELVYSLKKVKVVDSLADMPGEEDHFLRDFARAVYYENGQETVVSYPDYVLEDGSFDHGIRLVLAEIEVTSHDAEGLDDEHGYSDPYVFRSDAIMFLQDTGDNDRQYYLGYFDQYGSCEEHSLLYRLEPGETTTVTIGFIICERMDGSQIDLADLRGMIVQNNELQFLDLGL